MLYRSRCRNSLVDVYSLDEESDNGVWSKMYTIGPINFRNQYGRLSKCFKNGGENLIVDDAGQLWFYDHKTTETKFIRSSYQYLVRSCYSYTPSLVSVEGMESVMVLPFQEMELKNLALEYNNLVECSSIPMSDSSSSSGMLAKCLLIGLDVLVIVVWKLILYASVGQIQVQIQIQIQVQGLPEVTLMQRQIQIQGLLQVMNPMQVKHNKNIGN